jgi:hypothetical protein
MNAKHIDRWVMIAIVFVGIVFFAPLFSVITERITGHQFTDMVMMFYPLHQFVHDTVASGHIPTWNPFIFCGQPTIAEGQISFFYPINILTAFLPTVLGENLSVVLHFIAIGVFFFLYLREIGVSTTGAALGALVFQYSTVPIARFLAGHYIIMPYLPLYLALLLVWERWRKTGTTGNLFWAAIIYGSFVLCAYPQCMFYGSLYIGFHMLFGTLYDARTQGIRPAFSRLSIFCIALVVGICLGAVQLLPTLDFVADSSREKTTLDFCGSFSFPPENFLTLLVPGFFGDAIKIPYWGRAYIWEVFMYIGLLPLALAFTTAIRVRNSRSIAHAIAVVIFLVLALGENTPLFAFLYHNVPGFDMFRGSSKFSMFAVLSLSTLAAMGYDRLHSSSENTNTIKRDWLSFFLVVSVLFFVCISLFMYFRIDYAAPDSLWSRLIAWRFRQGETIGMTFSEDKLPPSDFTWIATSDCIWRSIKILGASLLALLLSALICLVRLRSIRKFHIATTILIFSITFVDVFFFSRGYQDTTAKDFYQIPQHFIETIRSEKPVPSRIFVKEYHANIPMLDGLQTNRGYAGLILSRTNELMQITWGAPGPVQMTASIVFNKSLTDIFYPDVKYVMYYFQTDPEIKGLIPVDRKEYWTLFKNPLARPRAYFSDQISAVPSREIAHRLIASGKGFFFEKKLDVVESSGAPVNAEPCSTSDTVRVVSYEAERVAIDTASSGPRLLVLTDAFDRHWECRIDGQPATIYPTNLAYRGVAIPTGKHEVVFTYHLPALARGAMISLATLFALIVGFGVLAISKKRKHGAVSEEIAR